MAFPMGSGRWGRIEPPQNSAPPPPPRPPEAARPVVRSMIAEFPEKFRPLLEEHARYKVFYGGRGGAKSWQFARALLLRGLKGNLRVLCTRETQSSLAESVHKLLSDQIKLLGLSEHYKVLKTAIRGPDGTEFIFKGLSDPEALKSAEGVDVVWIEEARMVSETSWKKLDPTIRKPGAEIWISMNPELETDWLYKLFVKGIKGKPPPNSIVVKVGYGTTRGSTRRLSSRPKHMRETTTTSICGSTAATAGSPWTGAVYAKELRRARAEERITRCPSPASGRCTPSGTWAGAI
jgi:phage terminase large subunit